MKKATVIVIAAICVASVLVVGIFGMKALIYTEIVYIQDIVFADNILGKEVKPATDGSDGFTVVVKYEDELVCPVEFFPVPSNATMRNDIDVSMTYQSGNDDDPCATYESGAVIFHKKGMVTIKVASTDGGKVTKELRIIAI